MFIKYNGSKDKKSLQWAKEHYGIMTYVWSKPSMVCEITNAPFLRFLLHPSRNGLFSMVDDPKSKKEEITTIPKETETPKKPRGRKKKVTDVDRQSGSTGSSQ